MEKIQKENLEKLTIYYNKKENRDKFISNCKKKTSKYKDWISKAESKVPKKVLTTIKKKATDKYTQDLKEWSIIGLLKDAVLWTKEAIFPNWERTKGRIADRLINRWAVTYIFTIVVAVNTIMDMFFITHLGPAYSWLSGVIVAPITEEIYKYLTIQLDEKEWGWFYFNVGEWLQYVKMYGGVSFKNIPYMILRFICTLGHLLYTKIWADKDKDLPKGLPSLLHAFHNGPFAFVCGLVEKLGFRLFGFWGTYFAALGMLLSELKIILSTIIKIKHPEKEKEPISEPIPQSI